MGQALITIEVREHILDQNAQKTKVRFLTSIELGSDGFKKKVAEIFKTARPWARKLVKKADFAKFKTCIGFGSPVEGGYVYANRRYSKAAIAEFRRELG